MWLASLLFQWHSVLAARSAGDQAVRAFSMLTQALFLQWHMPKMPTKLLNAAVEAARARVRASRAAVDEAVEVWSGLRVQLPLFWDLSTEGEAARQLGMTKHCSLHFREAEANRKLSLAEALLARAGQGQPDESRGPNAAGLCVDFVNYIFLSCLSGKCRCRSGRPNPRSPGSGCMACGLNRPDMT
jgi:hypothetical protein